MAAAPPTSTSSRSTTIAPNVAVASNNNPPNLNLPNGMASQPTVWPKPWNNSVPQSPPRAESPPQEPQKSVAAAPVAPLVVPPLDPPREIKPPPQPPTDPSPSVAQITPNAAPPDPGISRLKDLGFTASIESSWNAVALSGLREFKIVNHLPPDTRLDSITTQALQSPRAIARNRSFLGGWATDTTCTQGTQLTISVQEARTEGGVCTFDAFLPNRSGWAVRGHCQVGADKWPATIKFAVSGTVLSWSSAKGNATYYRCR